MSLSGRSVWMMLISRVGFTSLSKWETSTSLKAQTTWKIPSTARTWDKNAFPRPPPVDAPDVRLAMSVYAGEEGRDSGGGFKGDKQGYLMTDCLQKDVELTKGVVMEGRLEAPLINHPAASTLKGNPSAAPREFPKTAVTSTCVTGVWLPDGFPFRVDAAGWFMRVYERINPTIHKDKDHLADDEKESFYNSHMPHLRRRAAASKNNNRPENNNQAPYLGSLIRTCCAFYQASYDFLKAIFFQCTGCALQTYSSSSTNGSSKTTTTTTSLSFKEEERISRRRTRLYDKTFANSDPSTEDIAKYLGLLEFSMQQSLLVSFDLYSRKWAEIPWPYIMTEDGTMAPLHGHQFAMAMPVVTCPHILNPLRSVEECSGITRSLYFFISLNGSNSEVIIPPLYDNDIPRQPFQPFFSSAVATSRAAYDSRFCREMEASYSAGAYETPPMTTTSAIMGYATTGFCPRIATHEPYKKTPVIEHAHSNSEDVNIWTDIEAPSLAAFQEWNSKIGVPQDVWAILSTSAIQLRKLTINPFRGSSVRSSTVWRSKSLYGPLAVGVSVARHSGIINLSRTQTTTLANRDVAIQGLQVEKEVQ
ncbi:hypothetical protein BDZ89DRAFT_1045089 [Hymenopellis radicata]|nr:hypothetical protein BDZ89DRAFT_1045089 [Hymenopellis radicata]